MMVLQKIDDEFTPTDRQMVVEDLNFSYPQRRSVLTDLSFEVKGGEILGLVGTNGSGKSTLLDLMAGILVPDGGKIILSGQQGTSHLRQKTALLPQNVDHWLLGETPREDLELAVGGDLLQPADPSVSILDIAEQWGLLDILDEPVETLSVGQKKRLALASSLAGNPEVVLLDEPFSGLDWPASLTLLEDLARLPKGGVAVILATHDPQLVVNLVSHWLLLKPGAHLWAKGEEATARFAEFGVRPLETVADAAVLDEAEELEKQWNDHSQLTPEDLVWEA
jgi:biotin transport system ATP-binding protein